MDTNNTNSSFFASLLKTLKTGWQKIKAADKILLLSCAFLALCWISEKQEHLKDNADYLIQLAKRDSVNRINIINYQRSLALDFDPAKEIIRIHKTKTR